MKCYIGIDPGSSSGCIAAIHLDDKGNINGTFVWEFSKLTTKEWFLQLKYLESTFHGECMAILEKVHTMPKQGVVSAGTFMRNVGQIEMALLALEVYGR